MQNMIPEISIDSGVLSKIDPHFLRHLALTGRHGYFSQGFYGESSTVAVIDTGVNPRHPELLDDSGKSRVLGLLNFCRYGNGEDDNGHGTHVAGTIAGRNVGVAPKAKILSVKVLDGAGGSDWNTISAGLEAALKWRDSEGRKVTAVSMSLSNTERAGVDRLRNAIKALTDAEIPVICSAGNTGTYQERYPASFYEPITVGAVDVDNLEAAAFTTQHPEVDLCQVGVNVLSAWYEGGYRVMSGTSMSTPIVSGIVALVKDKHFRIFGEDMPEMVLYWMLKNMSKDLGAKGSDLKTGAGFCSLQPVVCDLYTRAGDKHMTLNDRRIDLLVPVAVLDPGVTMLPARAFVENCFGGLVEWNPETKFGRYRL
jgi:major intracellular serine protease